MEKIVERRRRRCFLIMKTTTLYLNLDCELSRHSKALLLFFILSSEEAFDDDYNFLAANDSQATSMTRQRPNRPCPFISISFFSFLFLSLDYFLSIFLSFSSSLILLYLSLSLCPYSSFSLSFCQTIILSLQLFSISDKDRAADTRA